MAWYRRSKSALDFFRNFTSKFTTKNPIRESFQKTNHYSSSPPNLYNSRAYGCSFYSSSIYKNLGFQLARKQNQYSPFLHCAKRYYYLDRYKVQRFRPRKWYKNPRIVLTVVLVGSGVAITVYYGHLETVPYTNRKHFVLLSPSLEKELGEKQFQQIKVAFKGKILPAIHPESVRVSLIAREIMGALQRGLRKDEVWSEPVYGSDSVVGVRGTRGDDMLMALRENAEGKWSREDEILNDGWVEESRKKGKEKGLQPNTKHLEGLNWEVLVVDEPVVNAFCLPGGKIVVFTGLLEHFRLDEEIATVLGHEDGDRSRLHWLAVNGFSGL